MKNQMLTIATLSTVFLVTACGGDNTKTNTLENVAERGTIVIGTTGNNRPSIFKSGDGFEGYEADWISVITSELGVEPSWETVDFKGIIPGLQAEKFDVALSGIRVTPERQEVVDFTNPIATEDVAAVYPEGTSGIESPEDIDGKTVCVVTGSSNGQTPVEKIGTAKEVVQFPGVSEALSGLKSGRCEVMVTGRAGAADWQKHEGDGYEVSSGGVDCLPIAIALPKGQPELKKRLNEIIDQHVADGLYDEIAEEWLGGPFPDCGK